MYIYYNFSISTKRGVSLENLGAFQGLNTPNVTAFFHVAL